MAKEYSSSETQEMLNALVENDKGTYLNLEYSRQFIDKLKKDTGFDIPWAEQKYQQLARTYANRQGELRSSKYIKAQDWVDNKIEAFKNWIGLGTTPQPMGALPAIPVAVGFVAAVELGVSVWQLFKPH